jgi:poly-gamma-glutamate biosynthesis protein PgsC/CapC
MSELLSLSIGIGLVVSMIFSEVFGIAAGGMVVPGYIALSLDRPVDVALTIATGLATFAVVRGLSTVMIIFGRRRTVLMILVGYLMGTVMRSTSWGAMETGESYSVIGFIIPGLIAIWLDRQGIVETISTLITASVVVRLVLILIVGTDLL